ncbi:MAG TPA: pectate lyase [Longimicrobiaceae bacterium]
MLRSVLPPRLPALLGLRADGIRLPPLGSEPVRLLALLRLRVMAFALAFGSAALCARTAAAQIVRWNDVLEQDSAWYGGTEALRIADNVLLYQHPNGGWGKNVDMARPLPPAEREQVARESRTVETLIDNGATYTQLRFLARVHAAQPHSRVREAFLRGIDYLLEAEYERGGWPMIYPLQEGYYSHITFNDNAMIGVMRLLRDLAAGEPPFDFVDDERRARARAAIERGLRVILDTQIVVDGEPTAWCAQYHPKTLEPMPARSYELVSLSGMESVGIVEYLMEIPAPGPEVVRAIESAVRWFRRTRIDGIEVRTVPAPSLPGGRDRVVVADPDAPPLWARFYEIGTNRPMFVGRDGVVRDRLADIEHERRMGYAYLGSWARELLEVDYPAWRARMQRSTAGS